MKLIQRCLYLGRESNYIQYDPHGPDLTCDPNLVGGQILELFCFR